MIRRCGSSISYLLSLCQCIELFSEYIGQSESGCDSYEIGELSAEVGLGGDFAFDESECLLLLVLGKGWERHIVREGILAFLDQHALHVAELLEALESVIATLTRVADAAERQPLAASVHDDFVGGEGAR